MTPALTPKFSDAPAGAEELGLGLDAGGTQTRWALAESRSGRIVAEGQVAGFSGTQLASEAGRGELVRALQALADEVLRHGRPARVYAGMTGLPEADGSAVAQMKALLSRALDLPGAMLTCRSDIDIAWRAAFAEPGEGYLLYAGTGSIAAFVDAGGQLQRAGGRGALLGDEGGGFWIARQALAQIWRMEDAEPGSAERDSPLARRVFAALGGSDWASSRAFIYGASRGRVGQLALAVAAAAEEDAAAAALLRSAGTELARLAQALLQRFGPRPVVAAGRALLLHPLIEQGLRGALPPGTPLHLQQLQPHRTAALLAARPTENAE
ncbi:MAG: BadF/BadG/BcrA/BcrD ATPase family protein [Burkholderiaceae bacterium]